MITQRFRTLNNTLNYVLLHDTNIFNGLELYEFSSLPAWITKLNPSQPYIQLLELNPVTLGTYTYQFTLGGSPSVADATLIIEVVDSLTTDLRTCNNSDAITLVWINREGGRSSYIFDQRKDFNVNQGDSKTFDNNGTIKYINRGKNFNGKVVYKTGISEDEIDLLKSLRNAIQVWEYDSVTDISTPIHLDLGNFNLYNTKTNFYEINIKYKLSKYETIQNQ